MSTLFIFIFITTVKVYCQIRIAGHHRLNANNTRMALVLLVLAYHTHTKMLICVLWSTILNEAADLSSGQYFVLCTEREPMWFETQQQMEHRSCCLYFCYASTMSCWSQETCKRGIRADRRDHLHGSICQKVTMHCEFAPLSCIENPFGWVYVKMPDNHQNARNHLLEHHPVISLSEQNSAASNASAWMVKY